MSRGSYVLSASGPGQSGWCWCKSCQGLFFAGAGAGVCPAGGAHDGSGSGTYVLSGGTIDATWTTLSSQPGGSPHIAQLSYSDDGILWAVDPTVPFQGSAQNLYIYDGAAWRLLNAYVTAIAEDRIGLAWGVNGEQITSVACNIYVFYRSAASPQWAAGIVGLLTSIAIGANSDVWGVNGKRLGQDNVYRYIGGSNTWAVIPSSALKLTQIAAGGPTPGGAPGVQSSVWAISTAASTGDNVYRYVGGDSAVWALVPGVHLTQISVAADGSVVGIDASGAIWAFNFVGASWVRVSGNATAVAAGSDGLIWAISGGVVKYAVLSEVRSSIEVDGHIVQIGVYGPRDATQLQGGSLSLAPLQLLREPWTDDSYRAQQQANPPDEEHQRAPILGDTVSSVLEVSKFVWDILKDGRPTYSGPHVVQSSVLNPSDTNWIDYQSAVPGKSAPVTFRRKNAFGVTRVEFTMRLGGTYNARPGLANITPGYYIPEIHFEFSKTDQGWGVTVNGSAIITAVSNLGSNTTANPVNPYVTIIASLQASTILQSVSETFTFTATGKTGFVATG